MLSFNIPNHLYKHKHSSLSRSISIRSDNLYNALDIFLIFSFYEFWAINNRNSYHRVDNTLFYFFVNVRKCYVSNTNRIKKITTQLLGWFIG